MFLCKCGCEKEIEIRPWHKSWYQAIIYRRYGQLNRTYIYEGISL